VIQLRRDGIRASAPVFVPFLGAVVGMKQMPDDALMEARVGLAGPILGSAGAAVCLAIAVAANSPMLRALAYVGFLINLINLVPLVPFDGGRAMAAMAPGLWFVGLGVMLVLLLSAKPARSSRRPTTASRRDTVSLWERCTSGS
jgi:Zn-dependent protease